MPDNTINQAIPLSTDRSIEERDITPTNQKGKTPPAGSWSTTANNEVVFKHKDITLTISEVTDKDGNPILPPPGTDAGTMAIFLESLQDKITNQSLQSLKLRFDSNQKSITVNIKNQIHQIDEQNKKAIAAAKKAKKNWLANLFSKIFGVLLMIAAAIATVATAGAATPLLVAATVLSVALIAVTVSDIAIMVINKVREDQGKPPIPNLGEVIAKGISAALVAMGADKAKADIAGAVLSGVLIMAVTILSAVLSFQVAKAAVDVPLLLTRILKVAQGATTAAQGAATIAQGVFSIQIGKLQKDLAYIAALIQELQANKQNAEKMADDIQQLISQLFDVLKAWSEKVGDIISKSGDGTFSIIRQIKA